ncbi:hypothetical protein BP00DRAFT_368643, partial [Aspergillus indologenus CBS 114.80]
SARLLFVGDLSHAAALLSAAPASILQNEEGVNGAEYRTTQPAAQLLSIIRSTITKHSTCYADHLTATSFPHPRHHRQCSDSSKHKP